MINDAFELLFLVSCLCTCSTPKSGISKSTVLGFQRLCDDYHLIVDNRTITSHHYKAALDVRPTQSLKQYLQKKFGWTEFQMHTIDWDGYQHAIRNWKPPKTQHQLSTFLPKFLHCWLPVGKMVSRYNPQVHQAYCPSCEGNILEDQTHMLKCPSRQACQRDLKITMRYRSEAISTDPMLSRILVEALHMWLWDLPFPATEFPE